MHTLFKHLFDVDNPELFDFQTGYAAGIIVSVLLILLMLIIKIIFHIFFAYPKRTSGITVKEPDGDIFITASAIIDLINSISKNFPEVKFEKINLLERRNGFSLKLHISFNSAKVTLPEIKGHVKEKIYSGVKSTFGIESIDQINIKIVNAPSA